MPILPIQVVVNTQSTRPDRNGNRYHAATITALSGESYHLCHVDGDRSVPLMLHGLGLEWSEIHQSETTVGTRELSRQGALEHHAAPFLWHMIPRPRAIPLLGSRLAGVIRDLERCAEVENDGSLPESYRLQHERIADKAREFLVGLCAVHGAGIDFPGIFPLITYEGRDHTLTLSECVPFTRFILERASWTYPVAAI